MSLAKAESEPSSASSPGVKAGHTAASRSSGQQRMGNFGAGQQRVGKSDTNVAAGKGLSQLAKGYHSWQQQHPSTAEGWPAGAAGQFSVGVSVSSRMGYFLFWRVENQPICAKGRTVARHAALPPAVSLLQT